MAQRRMFSLKIVDSDAFLDMGQTSQLLYFHLSMRADDDGFIGNPKKIMRMIGSSDDDLKVLLSKRFLLPFDNGIVVIKHWKIHNYIQNDRYSPTQYIEEKKLITEKENGAYTECIQDVSTLETQVRLGEVRVGKGRTGKVKPIALPDVNAEAVNEVMKLFYEINPSLNFANKTYRKSAEWLIEKYGLEKTRNAALYAISIQGEQYAPQILNPHQLKEKMTALTLYKQKQKPKDLLVIG